MALGRKTGGRTKGTPNKKTLDAIERLEQLGCDPIQVMAKIAMDDAAPIEVRARMFSELATYVAPKRKAVEHSAKEERGRSRLVGCLRMQAPNSFDQRR